MKTLMKIKEKLLSMKIYIDSASAEKIIVEIDGDRFEAESRHDKSQMLLSLIQAKLLQKGKTFKDITKVDVNTGPGSFTGLRVGVSVANAICWALGIKKSFLPRYEGK